MHLPFGLVIAAPALSKLRQACLVLEKKSNAKRDFAPQKEVATANLLSAFQFPPIKNGSPVEQEKKAQPLAITRRT